MAHFKKIKITACSIDASEPAARFGSIFARLSAALILSCYFCLFPRFAKPDPIKRKFDFIIPSKGENSSYYGYRRGKFHSGVDISSGQGKDVRAAESGTVSFSGRKKFSGRMIIINHGGGWTTIYAHNLKNYVREGQKVVQGQKIAKMGADGRATGVHLHFEIRFQGKALDPLKYVKGK